MEQSEKFKIYQNVVMSDFTVAMVMILAAELWIDVRIPGWQGHH